MNSSILSIAGMHRSGTSLTAGWLAKCGLYVGDDLLQPTVSNPKGHFEDLTISHFQRRILSDAGWDTYLVTEPVVVNFHKYSSELFSILESNSIHRHWGWKDPRTCLLLPFWKHYLPQLKVLAVYRPYTQVIASLLKRERLRNAKQQGLPSYFNRGIKALRYSQWNIGLTTLYLKVWSQYNEDLLEYQKSNPDDIILFHIDSIINHSTNIIQFLNTQWGFNLEIIDIHSFYEPHMLSNQSLHLLGINTTVVKHADEIYQQLEKSNDASLRLIG